MRTANLSTVCVSVAITRCQYWGIPRSHVLAGEGWVHRPMFGCRRGEVPRAHVWVWGGTQGPCLGVGVGRYPGPMSGRGCGKIPRAHVWVWVGEGTQGPCLGVGVGRYPEPMSGGYYVTYQMIYLMLPTPPVDREGPMKTSPSQTSFAGGNQRKVNVMIGYLFRWYDIFFDGMIGYLFRCHRLLEQLWKQFFLNWGWKSRLEI